MAGERRRQKRRYLWWLLWGAVSGAAVIVGLASGSFDILDRAQESLRDPLRVNYAHVRTGRYDGAVPDFDPDRSPTYYIERDKIIYSASAVVLEVVRREGAGEEDVRLAPYLVIGVTEIEPIPETVDYIFQTEVGGAGGVARPFETTLSPKRGKIFGAPQSASVPDQMSPNGSPEDEFDFFTVAPGQSETFILNLNKPALGNYYRFRVGVQYSYKGEKDVSWSEEFVTGVPKEVGAVWTYRQPRERFVKNELLTKVYPNFKTLHASQPPTAGQTLAARIKN